MSADRDPPAGPIAEQFSRGRTVAEIEEVLEYTRDEIRDVLCTEERLRHLYHEKGLSQREIGERLGMTQPEVSRAMSRKGIGTRHPPDWTDEEDEILREHYHHWPKKRILNALDRRTWKAIIDRARKIGVARSAEEHRHSKEVKDRLRTNAEENRIEIDFGATDHLSYIIGVVDGDGFHDGEGTIGLENTSPRFVEKFREALETVGMNPGRSRRRGNMETVWAASQQLVEWIDGTGYEEKRTWLDSPGDGWKYIEGRYESDGNIHPSGSPRICSYDRRARRFIHRLLQERGISCSIQQNNVWISRPAADDFFDNINPVIRKQE